MSGNSWYTSRGDDMTTPFFRVCLYAFTLLPAMGHANNNYPLEFQDFFESHEEQVEVTIEGGSRTIKLKASVSYDTFQLLSSQVSVLRKYLAQQNINSKAIATISEQLKNGIDANPGCLGLLQNCIPTDVPQKAEFVFDYDRQLLRIFISSDMLKKEMGKKEYYDLKNKKSALINNSDLYFYLGDSSKTLNWNNITTLGLPFGHLNLDTQLEYTNEKSEFTLSEAMYQYEYKNKTFLLGFQDTNNISLNSTDFLVYGANYSGLSASFGSSYNLLKGDKKSLQRFYFYATQGGQLEVYRDQRLLLSKTISSGEQSIGYDELPFGTYTITFRVRQSDNNIVLEEQALIVNSSSFNLAVNDWDYRFDIGRLDENYYFKDTNYQKIDELNYLRSLFSYRPHQRILTASGLVSDGKNTNLLFGSKFSISSFSEASYTISALSKGELYQSGQLRIHPFSFDFNLLTLKDLNNVNQLTHSLYGNENKKEYSFGVFGEWFLGRTFLNYFYSEIEGIYDSSSSENLSLNWSHSLMGGDLSFNINVNRNNHGEKNFNAGLTWSKKFGESGRYQLGTNFDKNSISQLQASLSHSHEGENWHGSSLLGLKKYRDKNAVIEGSGSLYGENDKIKYNAYGFVSSDKNYSVSGSLSSTQLLASEGGAITSKQGTSFLELIPEWEDSNNKDDNDATYQLLKNNKYWSEEDIPIGKSRIIDLPLYDNINFNLDLESSNTDSKNSNGEFLTVPGSYYKIINKISAYSSQIFVFNDMNGDPVTQVRCIGTSCKSVEELSGDGVFRVNFIPGKPFKLVSNKRLCVYNSDLIGKRYIQAYCLPGLENQDGFLVRDATPEALVTNKKDNDDEAIIYIGKYESNEETKAILSQLNKAGLKSKSIDISGVKYIYVHHNENYTLAQIALLESLDAYVILDNINTNQLFSSRTPK